MMNIIIRYALILCLALAAWIWDGQVQTFCNGDLIASAKAVIGRPATPVSYAGVARRTTIRVATPGLGAPGVGVTPGVGAGAPGVGVEPANRGGPVNRVGRF